MVDTQVFILKVFQLLCISEIFHNSILEKKKSFCCGKNHILHFFFPETSFMSPVKFMIWTSVVRLVLDYSSTVALFTACLFFSWFVKDAKGQFVSFNAVSTTDTLSWENVNHHRLQKCFYEVKFFLVANLSKEGIFCCIPEHLARIYTHSCY